VGCPAAMAAVLRPPRLGTALLAVSIVLVALLAIGGPESRLPAGPVKTAAVRAEVRTVALVAATGERTVTTLAASTGPGSRVALTAAVTTTGSRPVPVDEGTVRFYVNGARTPLGIAPPGTGASRGTYLLTVTRPLSGLQRAVAVFAPLPGGSYLSSHSAAVLFREQPACRNCRRAATASTTDGALSLSTPFTASSPLDLGTLTLNSSGTFYTASGWLDPNQADVPTEGASPDPTFDGITVVDTQADNTPWTVSALASDLSDGLTGPGNLISGEDVGLTGLTAVAVTGDPLTAADLTLADQPAASPPVGPFDVGTLGLGGPAAHLIISDAAQADGTIGIDGVITINAPTSTQPGVYGGTITITIAS
jgi:hypothetical protein